MKNLTKRIASLVLALALTVPAASAALALQPGAPTVQAQNVYDTCTELLMDPRYGYITRISSGLSIDKSGRADCTGSCTPKEDYKCALSMELQQYKDDHWKVIKTWSKDYTGAGVKLLNKGYYVSKGYDYRLTTYMEIWDGDELLESAFCDSPVYTY